MKKHLKRFLLRSGLLKARQMTMPRSAAILAYHSVSSDRAGQAYCVSPGITVQAERFREQMSLLRRSYHPVTMDEIAAWLREGIPLPRRSVAVTFDDGFADNYHVAAPIMEEFDVRGAVYLTVDSVIRRELPWFCRILFLLNRARREKRVLDDPVLGRRWNFGAPDDDRAATAHYNKHCAALHDEAQRRYVEELESTFGYRLDMQTAPQMIDFEQARDLRRRGHTIGAHSFSHANLAHLPVEALEREMIESHEILQRELDGPVEHFSYPHPSLDPQWNDRTLALTEKLNYKTAVLTRQGLVTRHCEPLLLPRVIVVDPDAESFRWKLETAFAGIRT